MNKKFLADIQVLKNAMNSNKLVLFVGAGISIDANVPSWSHLIENIKDDLNLPDNEKDYLKIAQIYFNDRQEKEYVEKIRKILGHKKLRYNEIHEELFELNPEHILTTNFEDLLEQVITKNSLPYSIIREDKDLPYSNNTKLLVKVHGDLDLGNLVFKEDDYLEYPQKHPLLDSFIKSIFSTKIVLFIGYSFNDYNLKQIVQYVRNILGNNFQNAYLLSLDKEVHQSHKQYLKNKGINVINYFDADYVKLIEEEEINSNYIEDFLKEDNIYGSKNTFYKKGVSLSEKGQLLLNFLKFIRFYDKLKTSLTKDNVIDQLYDSLKRFEEVKCLPQDFISKLYPFKSISGNEYLIEQNSLLLKNEHLVDLFLNKIKIENSEITLINLDDKFKHKIQYILRKLNNALIYFVSKENEKPDSLGFKGFSGINKSIDINSNKNCNCSKCKYDRYQLKESLIETNNYNVNDTTDIKEDMQKAFLHYKFGNYFQSFKMFEEIASKAWITQKFITYFIAKNNMKSLRNLIPREYLIDKKKIEDAIEKIEDIDIDKLIYQIPNKSDDEYNLLKIIRDDSVLIKANREIEEYHKKILETYKLFQNRYSFSLGPNYPWLIYFELYKLLIFYNENFIIKDEFSEFKNIINLGVEALIINYSTDNRYQGKIKEFDVDYFDLVVPYLNADNFLKTLKEYKVKDIKFREENLDKIIDYSNNFFSSYYEKNTRFGGEYNSYVIESQLQKRSFENKTITIFNNITLFLSLIEINKDQFNLIKNNLFKFLSFNVELHHNSIKYLKSFLLKNYLNITKEDCNKLLEISNKDIYKHHKNDFVYIIAEICNANNFGIIDEIQLAKKLLYAYDFQNRHSDTIISLWIISANQEVKNFYYNNIIERLENNFDIELYKSATLNNIIDYNLFFEDFISYLNTTNKDNNIENDGYEIEDGKPKFNSFQFHNDLLFLYRLRVKSNDPRLNKLENMYEYMQFCIFRNKYDFSKFKIEWLYLFNYETFYNEFKKIKPLKKILESSLKENYNEELAKVYSKYFI
ncbi:SIR2 family protein [Empedobacter brevis]|uniref:SIR2 family protein n=1 Tax=Empedobacter brevis TaxID=247 RepID=UPI002FE195BF